MCCDATCWANVVINRNNGICRSTEAFLKLHCDMSFQRAFTACSCVFKANQHNFFENANTCRKHLLKKRVATQLKSLKSIQRIKSRCHFLFLSFFYPKLPQKIRLASKVFKSDSKMIILIC